VWKFTGATRLTVGFIPNPAAARCNPSGIAFDAHGDLYIADGGPAATVWRLTPNAATPPLAVAFATGVPGTNGLAFDGDGNLWTGDGTTGQGRVWKIQSSGGACEPTFSGCVEAFRIQPMANAAGVGRSNGTLQPGNVTPNPQPLVANGLAFTPNGDLLRRRHGPRRDLENRISPPGRAEEPHRVRHHLHRQHAMPGQRPGRASVPRGHRRNHARPRGQHLELRQRAQRHRRRHKDRDVVEVFRNPVNAAGLRNSADPAVGNNHILELPTSPVLFGKRFCTANSDGNRRDNSPNSAGEVNQGGAVGARGKISCMDQDLEIPGARLPVR
jgi:hypothetical protein